MLQRLFGYAYVFNELIFIAKYTLLPKAMLTLQDQIVLVYERH